MIMMSFCVKKRLKEQPRVFSLCSSTILFALKTRKPNACRFSSPAIAQLICIEPEAFLRLFSGASSVCHEVLGVDAFAVNNSFTTFYLRRPENFDRMTRGKERDRKIVTALVFLICSGHFLRLSVLRKKQSCEIRHVH